MPPVAQQHPLIQKLTDLVRVARTSNQSADTHDSCMQFANEIAAFIVEKTKPAELPADAPIPGPGSTPDVG